MTGKSCVVAFFHEWITSVKKIHTIQLLNYPKETGGGVSNLIFLPFWEILSSDGSIDVHTFLSKPNDTNNNIHGPCDIPDNTHKYTKRIKLNKSRIKWGSYNSNDMYRSQNKLYVLSRGVCIPWIMTLYLLYYFI